MKWWLIFLLVSLLALSIHAQSSGYTLAVEEVRDDNYPLLEIALSAREGEALLNHLGKDDFSLLVDGQPMNVLSVRSEQAKMGLVLVIDSSASMSGLPLRSVQATAKNFLKDIQAGDEVAIVEFDTTARQVLPFTQNVAEAEIAINMLQADGKTALFDAALGGVEVAARSLAPRRFMVLISDGNESGGISQFDSRQRANDSAQVNDIVIFTVGLGPFIDERYLRELATNSGGQFLAANRAEDMQSVYETIRTIIVGLRTRYVITLDLDDVTPSEHVYTVQMRDSSSSFSYTPDPERLILENHLWSPLIASFSGIEMVLVPSGCFQMGSDITSIFDEYPISEQCFKENFWLGRYEVTNKEFGSSGLHEGDFYPRDSVTWVEALEFCQSKDMRLPTEAEWEYAARGPSGWMYPWGGIVDNGRVLYLNTSRGTSGIVGSVPGASWVGSADMSGNVWEWTQTLYQPYPYNPDDGRELLNNLELPRVLRGGGFNNAADEIHTTNRFANAPTVTSTSIGFRCVRDFQEADRDLITGASS